jgi:hypothetical protein
VHRVCKDFLPFVLISIDFWSGRLRIVNCGYPL